MTFRFSFSGISVGGLPEVASFPSDQSLSFLLNRQGPVEVPVSKLRLPLHASHVPVYLQFCRTDIEPLEASLSVVGLTTPLVVVRRQSGTMVIVSGIRRFLACQNMNFTTVNAYVVDSSEVNSGGLLRFRLLENAAFRSANDVEIMCSLVSLHEAGVSIEAICQQWAALFHIPPVPETIRSWLTLATWKGAELGRLADGTLTQAQALTTAARMNRDRASLLTLLVSTRFNNKEYLQLLDIIQESLIRDRISLAYLFERCDIERLLGDESKNSREKTQLVVAALNRYRYPQLTDQTRELKEFIASLHLPPQISVNPPRDLEGDLLQISISARRPSLLEEAIDRLVQRKEMLKKLFDFF